MAERLVYRTFDTELADEISRALVRERTAATLARRLAGIRYTPTAGERRLLEWHVQHPSTPIVDAEVLGLRVDPAAWAGYAARRLLAMPIEAARNAIARICWSGTVLTVETPLWVLLAWASPLYRSRAIGELQGLDADFPWYDGPPAIADALGGVPALGDSVHAVLDRADVRRIAEDLKMLDLRRVPTGDLRRLRESWENAYGHVDAVDDVCRQELAEIAAFYDEMRNAGLGLVVRTEGT